MGASILEDYSIQDQGKTKLRREESHQNKYFRYKNCFLTCQKSHFHLFFNSLFFQAENTPAFGYFFYLPDHHICRKLLNELLCGPAAYHL